MEASKIVFVVNEAARLIRCSYDSEHTGASSGVQVKSYLFKTLDHSIAVDDLVVVETNTRHGFTVVKVTAVDLDVDFNDPTELKWAFSPLDLTAIKQLKAAEQAAIEKVRSIELKKQREDLRKAMFADDAEAMAQLTLANPNLAPGE